MLNGSGLLGNLGLLDSLSLNLALNEGDSLFSFLGNTRSLLLLKLSLVDFSYLGGSNSLLLLLSEDFLSFLNKSGLFSSLVFFNGGSLNLNLGNKLRGFNLETGALLLVSLSFSWVLRLLSVHTRSLRLNLLIFSNDLLLLINLLHLIIFLSNNSLLFFDFSGEGHLGISGAFTVANLAACSSGISFSKIDFGDGGNSGGIF